jgi:hypothetical protein
MRIASTQPPAALILAFAIETDRPMPSASRGRGDVTADHGGDGLQLLCGWVGFNAEILERGRTEQVQRILRGKDDGAGQRQVDLRDRQDCFPEQSSVASSIRQDQLSRS